MSLYVQREIMHHVMQTYLPSALIVVISWFSFWLDVDAAPARVSLSITTLLTIATQANAGKMELPEVGIICTWIMHTSQVSYMKAIDVWMGMCMTFVFGVMIEFTVCHFARNRVEQVQVCNACVRCAPHAHTGETGCNDHIDGSGSANGEWCNGDARCAGEQYDWPGHGADTRSAHIQQQP
jgi:hypothetical protein